MKKHVLLAVAVVLLCVLTVGTVSADGATTSVETFDALKTALTTGGTVVLANDISGDYSTAVAVKSVDTTLDLNGKTLSLGCTAGENVGFIIVNGTSTTQGKLTVKNGTITLIQKHASYKWATIFFASEYGTVVIEDGTYSAPAFVVGGNGDGTHTPPTIDIKGGKLTSTNDAVVFLSAKNTKLTMTNGEISGPNGIEIVSGTVDIKGGSITATSDYTQEMAAPSSGSIGTGGTAILLRTTNAYDGNIALTISDDAKITSKGVAIRSFIRTSDLKNKDNSDKTASVTISGGTIEGDIASFRCDHYTNDAGTLANPFTAITGGTFIVHTFDDLKTCLEAGANVKLGEAIQATPTEEQKTNYEGLIQIPSGKTSSLDLNGYALTADAGTWTQANDKIATLIWINGGSLTVEDTSTNKAGKIAVTGGKYLTKSGEETEFGNGRIFDLRADNAGSLTINNGNFEASYADIYVRKGSTATINGGKFTAGKTCFTPLGDTENAAKLVIKNCEAESKDYVVSGNGLCPEVDIDITGGKLTSTQAAAIYMPAAGTLDISGNTEISGSSGLEIRTGTVTISDTVQITATGEDQYAEDVSGDGSLDDGSAIVLHKKVGSYAGNIALTLSDSVKVTSEKGTAIRNYVRENNINVGETVTVTINGDNVRIQGENAAIENAKYTSESAVESAFIGTFNLQNGYYSAPSQGKLLVEVYPTYADTNHVMSDTPVKDGYYAPIEIKKQESSATTSDVGGTITITPNNAETAKDPENEKVVTITPSGDNAVTLILTYTEAPAIDDSGVVTSSSVPEKVVAGYKPVDVPESSGTVGTTFSLTVTTTGDNDLTLMQTDSLPTISTEINEDAKTKLQGAATLISMVTVDITKIKQKNPELTLAFKVPKSFFTGKDLSAVRAYHFDGTNIEEKGTPQRTEDGDNYVFTVTASTASPWMLGLKSSSPAPGPQPQPVYSSGDGNMENAFRVLFDTQGGSYVSPATGLSYGDKITAPANPVRDGYTFGGWYKDAACTQGWSFSDAIDGDMTLYAKWTGGSAVQQTTTATAQPTTKQTTAPQQTQSQSQAAATTAVPAATTAAGVTPTLTQAPAPLFGALLGLLAAGVLLRRRE